MQSAPIPNTTLSRHAPASRNHLSGRFPPHLISTVPKPPCGRVHARSPGRNWNFLGFRGRFIASTYPPTQMDPTPLEESLFEYLLVKATLLACFFWKWNDTARAIQWRDSVSNAEKLRDNVKKSPPPTKPDFSSVSKDDQANVSDAESSLKVLTTGRKFSKKFSDSSGGSGPENSDAAAEVMQGSKKEREGGEKPFLPKKLSNSLRSLMSYLEKSERAPAATQGAETGTKDTEAGSKRKLTKPVDSVQPEDGRSVKDKPAVYTVDVIKTQGSDVSVASGAAEASKPQESSQNVRAAAEAPKEQPQESSKKPKEQPAASESTEKPKKMTGDPAVPVFVEAPKEIPAVQELTEKPKEPLMNSLRETSKEEPVAQEPMTSEASTSTSNADSSTSGSGTTSGSSTSSVYLTTGSGTSTTGVMSESASSGSVTPRDIMFEPSKYVVFNAPFGDRAVTYHMRVTNVSLHPVGFAIKTNALSRISTEPPNGILQPKEKIAVAVTVQSFNYDEVDVSQDRIAYDYIKVDPSVKTYSYAIFQGQETRYKKNIFIRYNP
ncbi:hypothetical protein L596_012818 [Steinernema carpocapsae]|uniref:MSP domain-containing protein n=1 Tax=Steinernema carpocapsae TaxID=34508 RepID=A0A4U5NZ32_STECR|nr:hypothetical protein L596_012818 [Steinernema carpocapsae]